MKKENEITTKKELDERKILYATLFGSLMVFFESAGVSLMNGNVIGFLFLTLAGSMATISIVNLSRKGYFRKEV
jgi:hypothetical protein